MLYEIKVKWVEREILNPVILGVFRIPEGVTVHATLTPLKTESWQHLLMQFVNYVHSL